MFRALVAALLFFAIQSAFTAFLAPLAGASLTVLCYASCFLTYAGLLWLLHRDGESMSSVTVSIVGAAVAIRLLLTFAEPVLSDDIFRYIWEGRVTAAGFNPFVHAPAAEILAALRDDVIWPAVNHPELPTIYPPASQLVFAAVAALGGGVTALKLVFVAVECLGVLAVWRLVGAHPKRLFGLAVYLLNPLVIMEVAWSGHLDVLAWVPLTLSLLILATRAGLRWHVAAGVLIGLSIVAKFLGVILIPYVVLRRWDSGKRALEVVGERGAMLAVAALVVASAYAPFADAGGKLFGGFGAYAASWRSNDGIFRGWESVSWLTLQQGDGNERVFDFPDFDDLALQHGFTKQWEGQTLPETSFATNQVSQTVSKALAALLVGLALLWCILAVRDPLVAAVVVLGCLYLVAPTVHPWYVAWLVPLAALRLNVTSIVFSAVVLASYVAWISYDGGGAWLIPWWVVTLEYSIVAAVLVWEIGRPIRK